MNLRAVSLLPLLLALTSAADQPTCKIIWTFKQACTVPLSALVNQANTWSSKKCRDGEEKCMYEVTKEELTYLEIKHTSPRSQKTSTITFEFNPPSAPSFCKVKGTSTTRDSDGNHPNDYCLLYNLMEGSGLTETQGYREIYKEVLCPVKEKATCVH